MPIEVTEKHYRTWPTWLQQSMLWPFSPSFLLNSSKLGTSYKEVVGSPKLDAPPIGLQGCTIVPRVVDDFHVYDFVPPADVVKANAAGTAQKKKILYLCGGAFQAPAVGLFHWPTCAMMAKTIPNVSVCIVSYPLAPLNSAPTAYGNIQKVMQTLLAESKAKGEKVIYMGDSAGGNLVLGLPLATIKENPNALMPAAIMAVSPAVNFNHRNPKSEEIERYDVMLTNAFCRASTAAWAGDWTFDDPRISPIMADLSQWAKHGVHVHGVIGTYDVLAPDGEEYMKKLQAAGVSGKWLIWDKQMHVFPLSAYLGTPEANVAMKWITTTLSAV